MAKFLPLTAIILLIPLLGIWGMIAQKSFADVSPMVLREDTRPRIVREASSSSSSQAHVIEVRVPAGMQFVASRKGKKYYAVDSAGGERIVPKNRVYFETAQEAESAGYVR